jgi:hypothetical protein
MILAAPPDRRGYDDENRAFLSSLGERISLEIDRLSASDEVRRYRRAFKIQRSLLPAIRSHVEGIDVGEPWQPARIVSADDFDLVPPKAGFDRPASSLTASAIAR